VTAGPWAERLAEAGLAAAVAPLAATRDGSRRLAVLTASRLPLSLSVRPLCEHTFVQFIPTSALHTWLGLRLQAGVLELADRIGSGPVARKSVWVRLPPPALDGCAAPRK
jgi:hypothetical protein